MIPFLVGSVTVFLSKGLGRETLRTKGRRLIPALLLLFALLQRFSLGRMSSLVYQTLLPGGSSYQTSLLFLFLSGNNRLIS